MSGLSLRLAPNERYLVNGALLENGDKPGRVRVIDADARVLRASDALKPEEVDTPAKQIYYAIQLLISGDLQREAVLPALLSECDKLHFAICGVDCDLVPVLCSMIHRGNHYSALCHLRHIIQLEARILAAGGAKVLPMRSARVAY